MRGRRYPLVAGTDSALLSNVHMCAISRPGGHRAGGKTDLPPSADRGSGELPALRSAQCGISRDEPNYSLSCVCAAAKGSRWNRPLYSNRLERALVAPETGRTHGAVAKRGQRISQTAC